MVADRYENPLRLNPVPNNAEFGGWCSDSFGACEKPVSLDTIHLDMPIATYDAIRESDDNFSVFIGNYICKTLMKRSEQRMSVRKHIKDILEVLNEGNVYSHRTATENGETFEDFITARPPAKFIHAYTKVLLYATACDRDQMVQAIEDATEAFDAMLVWGETAATDEGQYISLANHLKLIFQSNGRLLKDMDELCMFYRKSSKRLALDGEDQHLSLTKVETAFPLTVLRLYDTKFNDEDEDNNDFGVWDYKTKGPCIIYYESGGNKYAKIADWADEYIGSIGGIEDMFTPTTFSNYRVN